MPIEDVGDLCLGSDGATSLDLVSESTIATQNVLMHSQAGPAISDELHRGIVNAADTVELDCEYEGRQQVGFCVSTGPYRSVKRWSRQVVIVDLLLGSLPSSIWGS